MGLHMHVYIWGLWEEDLVVTLSMYLGHVHTWLRYINDVLIIWRGDVASLEAFMLELNKNDRNIKLTYTFDRELFAFLDLSIGVKDSALTTKTYRKETAANTHLRANSHHPRWLKYGIPIGQFKINC